MKLMTTLLLSMMTLMTGCNRENTQTQKEVITPASVIYSFPADGQAEVSPKTDIFLRFSHRIIDEEIDRKIQLSSEHKKIPFNIELMDGGRSLKLSPLGDLDLATDYNVNFSDHLRAEGERIAPNPNATGPAGIQFTTRSGVTGLSGLDSLTASFAVSEQIPSPEGAFSPMDFSTFRLRLTQPIHPQWREMGGSIKLVNSDGETIPATILAKGRSIAIDPCTTLRKSECGLENDVLSPDTSYSVVLSNLPNLAGQTLDYKSDFTPTDTSPTVILFQEVIDSGLSKQQQAQLGSERSILNGEVTNAVTLSSVLMGEAGPSKMSGGLFAELAYAPNFPGDAPLPFRVPKGSQLSSSSLTLNINGSVPIADSSNNSIERTGNLIVKLLTDATGYLYPNPYSDSVEAPRHVKLLMDASINTEGVLANAGLSQNLLGVELSGIALVRNGILTIDALGTIEPNLLGREHSNITLALHLEAEARADIQLSALESRKADTSAPRLLSWMPGPDEAKPGNRDQIQRPGDSIVLNFDEALDGESLKDSFTLFADGIPLPQTQLRQQLDGTVVFLNPEGGLRHGIMYALQIHSSLTDLVGNGARSQTLEFALPQLTAPDRSPIALTTYPGFPCASTGVNLSASPPSHGMCIDSGPETLPSGQSRPPLPVTALPNNRPIVVVFSQSMNLDTIRIGETFLVEKINKDGRVIGTVPGRLEKNIQRIRFYPDSPWEVGSFYRYTIASATAVNDCNNAVCSIDGYPLQTDLLVDPEDIGGPDLTIYFYGSESTKSVFLPLRNLPVRDTNSNQSVDCPTLSGLNCIEPFAHGADGAGGFLPSENSAKLAVVGKQANVFGAMVGASVGCYADEECPANKFIYQTSGLNAELIGPALDHEGNTLGVRVLLYPTMLATTSTSVYLDGVGPSTTGPLVLRMTYGSPSSINPMGLVEGIIVQGQGCQPTFLATADLTLDAPNLSVPIDSALSHDLYSKPFTLKLEGPIVFFDDGRMQIEQRNRNDPHIDVNIEMKSPVLEGFADQTDCLGYGNSLGDCLSGSGNAGGDIKIPLTIPTMGTWLNFVINPIKEIPEKHQ